MLAREGMMAKEVTHYIAGLEGPNRKAVAAVVKRVRVLMPEVEEGVSYAMPALLWHGKALLAVVVRKRFIAVYPFSGKVISALAGDLAAFRTTSGSVSFTPEAPLPGAVIDKLVKARRAEIQAEGR